eukprot:TRINITY_DN7276_c0_g1_i1.p1 TRINITY_DN7276_c0_g1~~TRINITY_DN7276_c0_g1_i1.p1  ORF type:complete len:191 (+),score=35.51 TRINITY_DN7276_c0_g1_i1:117-689(+)
MAFFELSRDGFVGVDPNEKLPHELPPPSRDVAFNGKMQRSSKVDGLTLAQRNAALRKSKSDLYTSLDEQERELRERESRRLAVKLAKQQQYQTAIYGQPEAKAKQKALVRRALLEQAAAKRAQEDAIRVAEMKLAPIAIAQDKAVHEARVAERQVSLAHRKAVTIENAKVKLQHGLRTQSRTTHTSVLAP